VSRPIGKSGPLGEEAKCDYYYYYLQKEIHMSTLSIDPSIPNFIKIHGVVTDG
jgi:hypothetical protein